MRVLALSILLVIAACGSGQWTHKGVASEKQASDLVGGFSDDDKKLYHAGLQHIYNAHQRPGQFTIGAILDEERARDNNRDAARRKQAERLRNAAAHRLDVKATANLKATMQLANSTGANMYRGGVVEGDSCAIKIDGNAYEYASDQDKSIIKQTVVQMCSGSYTLLGGNDSRGLPEGGLHVRLYNLADDIVYSDVVEPGPAAPAARVQHKKLAKADPRAAYKVLEHWDLPCSGRGGFGEKVMALSHRQSDLDAVYHRWMAEHNIDKSHCVSFMAYASERSYDAANGSSKFSEAELAAIPNGLDYMNNPNTGYEGWTDGEGHEHKIHAAQE